MYFAQTMCHALHTHSSLFGRVRIQFAKNQKVEVKFEEQQDKEKKVSFFRFISFMFFFEFNLNLLFF